jgi:hypothetical protein
MNRVIYKVHILRYRRNAISLWVGNDETFATPADAIVQAKNVLNQEEHKKHHPRAKWVVMAYPCEYNASGAITKISDEGTEIANGHIKDGEIV